MIIIRYHKLLNKKFSVAPRNLTSLTPTQLLEVVSRKLIRHKYVEIPDEPCWMQQAAAEYDKSAQGDWNLKLHLT